MKITIEKQALTYARKKEIEGIVIENTPVGCSCVGVHIHAQPEYILNVEKYSGDENFECFLSEEKMKIFVEKILLPMEEIYIIGKNNPFNKKIYLHCEVKKV